MTTPRKASHYVQHSLFLVNDFLCLILNISIDPHADVLQLWTVIFQSPAPQLWEMPQNAYHDD